MSKDDCEYLKHCLAKTYKGGTPITDVWYSDGDTTLHVASILDEEGCFPRTRDVIYFFEKPWKWESGMRDLVNDYEEDRKVADDYKHGDLVRYIPNHANGDATHPDCQNGVVSSTNEHFVFVKYDCPACTMFTGDEPFTAQATKRENLVRR